MAPRLKVRLLRADMDLGEEEGLGGIGILGSVPGEHHHVCAKSGGFSFYS